MSGKVIGKRADCVSAMCAGAHSCWMVKMMYSKQELL